MKIVQKTVLMIALFSLSLAVQAKDPGDRVSITPRVWNFSNMAQVDIWNTSEADIDCSGSIQMYTRSGRTQYEYYWETIYSGFSRTRSYYLRDYTDRITSVYHTIHCRER